MDEMSAEFVSRVNTLPIFLHCSMNMASLSPPLNTRSRASSTNLRPNCTLGRRRSTSCLQQECLSPIEPSSHESSLVLFLSKLIHVHGLSSPSTDDFVLPLSDSSHSIKPSHRLSVRILFYSLCLIYLFFPLDTRPHPCCYPPFPPLHRTSPLVAFHSSHFHSLASRHCGSCPTWSRTPRLLPEWSRSPLPCHRRHGCLRRMETRLVHSRERPLGLRFQFPFSVQTRLMDGLII